MKKTLALAFAAAYVSVFAGVNNVTITFSTPGPDKYSDGTTVLDGERYALVWSPKEEPFSGVNSDATAVGGSKVAVSAPVATGGRCPNVLFQVDEGYAKANYGDGMWSVVLLDTRKFALDKDGRPQLDEHGNRIVKSWGAKGFANGYGVIGNAVANVGGKFESAGGVAAESGKPSEDTPSPVVKGISVDGDNVLVTISSTKPALRYALVSGDSPGMVNEEVCEKEASGYGSETKDIVLIKKKSDGEGSGAEFFKVRAR